MPSKCDSKTVLVPPFSFDILHGCILGSMSLGTLTVATLLKQSQYNVRIVNPRAPVRGEKEEDIIQNLAEQILNDGPDIIGFSTGCGFYPLTMLVARSCKTIAPDTLIVAGGPQASVSYQALLQHCPWVDVVVMGEADRTVVPLWDALAANKGLETIPGLAFSKGGDLVETGPAPRVENLDDLPIPDYSLLPRGLWPLDCVTPVEAGRGCPYHCGFCFVSGYWGRKSRNKSAQRIYQEMAEVAQNGAKGILSLVHDMLAGNRDTLVELCDLLAAMPDPPKWECAIRMDHLDTELLEKMASAGCVSIFVGVESASKRIHDLVNKKLDLGLVREAIEMIHSAGINPVLSYVAGFPDESQEELLATLSLILGLRLGLGPSSRAFLHLLAPLHGTPIFEQYQDRLVLDSLTNPDICFLPFNAPQGMAMMAEHPDLCAAAYHFSGGPVPRHQVIALFFVMKTLLRCYATLSLLNRLHGDGLAARMMEALDRFRLDRPEELHFLDDLERETEHYLEGLFAAHEERAPYWRALFRYEAARVRFDLEEEKAKQAGLVVKLDYDVRGAANALQDPGEPLPVLPPQDEPLPLWLVAIGDRQLEVALPPELARSLE